MNNKLINKNNAMIIAKEGIYYNPACTHYGSNSGNVSCDFCGTSNLKCAIGYQSLDLCLKCTDLMVTSETTSNGYATPYPPKMQDLHKIMHNKPQTRMKQSSVTKSKPIITTNMMQDSVNHDSDDNENWEYMTFMMQDSMGDDY